MSDFSRLDARNLIFGDDEPSGMTQVQQPIQRPAPVERPPLEMPQQRATRPQVVKPMNRNEARGLIFGDAAPTTAPTTSPTPGKLTYDPAKTMGFIDQAVGSFAATDEQWKYHAAKTLYPNEPPEQAMRRFGKTPDGRAFHRGDDGKMYEVQPPSGLGRLANIGEGVGPALPAVTGFAGGLAVMPWTGGLGSIPVAGGTAYGGEVARQYLGNKLIGGAPSYSPANAIKEGVIGAAGQGIGVGLNRLAGRFAAPDIADFNPQATNRLYDQADRIGVRLTPAEATNMQSMIGEQTRLQSSPRAANTMRRFTAERNTEAGRAWDDFLNGISRPHDPGDLGRAAQDAARGIVDTAQAARTAAVEPFYTAAERQIGSVNPGGIIQFIQQQMPNAKGSERAGLRFALNQLQRATPEGATDGTIDMSFRGLNGAKQAIDAVLQNEDLAMKQGIDRTAHATLNRVRDMIVNAIDSSPGARGLGGTPGPYAAGRRLYGQISESTLQPMEEVLAPILRANRSNSSIVRVAQSVFDPSSRSPDLVTQARAYLEPRYPEVWRGMVRQFLYEKSQQALQENAKGTVTNVAGNIAKRVGEDKMEAVLRRALPPDQFRAYSDIMDVFRAAGRAVDANSDTAFKTEAIRQAKNRSRGMLRKVINNINPAQALRNFDEFMSDRSYERQAARIADIFTSGDRQAFNALRQLRQSGPNDVRRRLIIGHLLGNAAEYTEASTLGVLPTSQD